MGGYPLRPLWTLLVGCCRAGGAGGCAFPGFPVAGAGLAPVVAGGLADDAVLEAGELGFFFATPIAILQKKVE